MKRSMYKREPLPLSTFGGALVHLYNLYHGELIKDEPDYAYVHKLNDAINSLNDKYEALSQDEFNDHVIALGVH